jgi:leader peptidase (prepilin peptidase) / N-methyltransferase
VTGSPLPFLRVVAVIIPVGVCAGAGLACGWPQWRVARRVAGEVSWPQSYALALAAVNSAVLAVLGWQVRPPLVLAAMCWLAACLVPLAVIDVRTARLPDWLVWPAWSGTLVLLAAAAAQHGQWQALARAASGGLILAAVHLGVAMIAPTAVGRGDLKLSGSAGTALAWMGWSALAGGLAAGYLLAATYGIGRVIARRDGWRQHIRFGPFLAAGTLAVVLAASAVTPGSR